MEKYDPPEEFQRLLSALADDTLSDEQDRRLAEILLSDANARSYYLNFISMLTSLHWKYVEAAAPQDAVQSAPQGNEFSGSARRSWMRSALGGVAAAAVLLACAYLLLGWSTPVTIPDARQPVASISRIEKVMLANGAPAFATGDRIYAGRLQFASGEIQLQFSNGAILSASGPAELDIESEYSVLLNSGRVRVHAPPSAIGFSVRTEASRYVDLGTDFGVAVNDDQSSEVHVFDGMVLARPTGSEQVVPFMKQEAVRIECERGGMFSIAADATLFPRQWNFAETAVSTSRHAAQEPLPAGARVVYIGRWDTDRGVHLHMISEVLAQLPESRRPRLFNAGNSVPLFFDETHLERFVLPLKPTHAVIEFGPHISSKGELYDAPPKFEKALDRLLCTLKEKGIEPILRTGFRACETESSKKDYCEAYYRVIRTLAGKYGLRLMDVAAHFSALPDKGESLLLENHMEPTFEGSREIAKVELAALGYPELTIPQQFTFNPLPGIIREWRCRIRPTAEPLSAEEVAQIQPDAAWLTLQLPQADDAILQRSIVKWHSYVHRARAQGYAFAPNYDPKKSVEAVGYVDSEGEGDAYINTGGSLRAVWLNGIKILDDRKTFAWHPGRDRISVRLKPGRNTILVEAMSNYFLSVTPDCDWDSNAQKSE
jgi:ferric-dicitrate binding protein FerR (iron transport regulator)